MAGVKGLARIFRAARARRSTERLACARSDPIDELRKASGHLNYEVAMLVSLAHGIASGIAGKGLSLML